MFLLRFTLRTKDYSENMYLNVKQPRMDTSYLLKLQLHVVVV